MGKKRKTKEEKIRAKIRRLQKQLMEKPAHKGEKIKVKREKEEVPSPLPKAHIQKIAYSDTQSYLLSDIKKTFILTLLAIGLELVIYWWLKIK